MRRMSSKVENLPPYLFSELDKRKELLEERGMDVIDLGIGAPDLPTPDFVIDELIATVQNPKNHLYSPYEGSREFKEAVATFYQQHYGVELNPKTEILTLIGSKEGIAHLTQAVLSPGDVALIPNPGYPVYKTAVTLADGRPVDFPLKRENNYIPQFAELNDRANQAKLMFLNYPSNPTSATIHLSNFMEAITFAEKHDLLLANDAAYDLVTFGGYHSPSLLQVEGAKKRAIEFGSLSKSFNMAGWRIGYVVGNEAIINALATLKSHRDTSQFLPIQKAAAKALLSNLSTVAMNNHTLEERVDVMYRALIEMGAEVDKPKGTLFIWASVPVGLTSVQFAELLLTKVGVLVTPGTAFGSMGEGYIRLAVTVTKERLVEAIKRIQKFNFWEGLGD